MRSLEGARVWDVTRVWECEGESLHGPGRGHQYGMVQEPTVGSDKSLGWCRSLGGDISRDGAGAWGHYHGNDQEPGRGQGCQRSRGLGEVRSREGLKAGVGKKKKAEA